MSAERPHEADDLIAMIDELKDGVGGRVTDGETDLSEERYRLIRKAMLNAFPKDRLPEFLTKCRSLDECWPVFKGVADSWQGRRLHLAEVLNPLIDELEEGGLASLRSLERHELLGQGGFGQVYRYRHIHLDMDFAVKIFNPAFSRGGEDYLARFFQEARMLFSLTHPSIIQVYDAGLLGRTPFIRMELFEGRDLGAVLRQIGRIDAVRTVPIIRKVASALACAHAAGVVHRDLKPSNIMIAKPEQCRVIDFGLGVFLEQELASRLTRTGESIVGSQYTAPELLDNPRYLSASSDVYSLGAVWFEMLVGRPPVGVDASDRLSDVPGLDDLFAGTVLKCLKREEDRYGSAEALLERLDEIAGSEAPWE